jgi:hypothetical protein
MLIDGSQEPMIMHIPGFFGYLTTRFFTQEYKWRSTELFKKKVSDIASVKVEYTTNPNQSFEILNQNGKLSLKSLAPQSDIPSFDTAATYAYMSAFRKIHYETIVGFGEEKIDSILSTPYIFKISLTDTDGNQTSIKSYRKKNPYKGETDHPDAEQDFDLDRMYANVNDEREIVLIQFFVFDKLLKNLNYFETDPSQKNMTGEKSS